MTSHADVPVEIQLFRTRSSVHLNRAAGPDLVAWLRSVRHRSQAVSHRAARGGRYGIFRLPGRKIMAPDERSARKTNVTSRGILLFVERASEVGRACSRCLNR